ncbi:glycosyltransferase [Leptolyngbya sp. KIOST-1]|uniref:glycosyltransferase n=1 Tax=Leptolyngbya sp. KIOST-1 TaxID=1229172 RepID=UPI00055AC49D|nr:glycosyltransferase [Leptolyngbya sp. KIOST-1]
MKIFRISIPFWQHWLQILDQHPNLISKTWSEQQQIISENWFGYPPNWKAAFEPLGYEVTEAFVNIDQLQRKWVNDHQYAFKQDHWLIDIVEAQIVHEKPDILFLADTSRFSAEWINEIKEKCPSIKLVAAWCGVPWKDSSIFKACDLVLSCIPELVEKFNQAGCCGRHVNHAFDNRLLNKLNSSVTPTIDFSFVGNINRNNTFHLERDYILERIVEFVNIEIYSPITNHKETLTDLAKLAAKSSLYDVHTWLKKAPGIATVAESLPIFKKVSQLPSKPRRRVNPKLKPYLKQPVYGLSMFEVLQSSKLTFNKHIDASPRSASNLRLFEATGVGTCLVTDHKDNIKLLFEPDHEVVTYKSADECVEKVNWLLQHPKHRQAIAESGQRRTLNEHTLGHRAKSIDEIFKKALAQNTRTLRC